MTETEEQSVPDWEEVARRYGRFLFTVAYRLTGHEEDAQDLVQDVLLRVRRGLETYRPGSMEAWLSRITTNVFLDEVRRRKRRPTVALPDDPERVLPTAPSPDEALAAAGLPDHVQQALLRLPDDYRAAVVLCDVAGLSYSEIGEAIGVPMGTVRSRIHRGRAMLREVLA
ncbi:MAG TPA: sigma-70 family RNA polymerase sigma factor [Acidimicrobiales bacterium]|jgi:RNA polymerase sigma-70 factor (ECF subfamily)